MSLRLYYIPSLFFILSLAACSSKSHPHIQPHTAHAVHKGQQCPANSNPEKTQLPLSQTTEPTNTAHPAQPKSPLAYHRTSRNGIVLSLVSFDDRDYQLQVADQKNGPATHWKDAHTAALATGGVAAINGGFFTPEGAPLGRVITHGSQRGNNNQSSLGSGIFLSTTQTSLITRRGIYNQSSGNWGNIQHLLQSGPMLAENSSTISGLSKKSHRARSFIAWDGKHHWAIGQAESCTLSALSSALAGHAPAGFNIQTAINLDGGRSSDLWVGPKVNNGNHTHRGFFNKPVRNFLVITPKPKN